MAMTTEVDPLAHLREAGDFLRSRRQRLTPAMVGLPNGVRRRTSGLRREEVAMLAGVGTTWYTWLEQGRDVRPSNDVLSAIADALRLDPAERRLLFALHNRPQALDRSVSAEHIGAPLRRMLDSLTEQPAYIRGSRWDILAWNKAADAVYGPYERLQGDHRNGLYMLFADPEHRRLISDWHTVARISLAMFRGDHAQHVGDPGFERLVTMLTRISPEFAEWWPLRDVAFPSTGPKHINHPVAGSMHFEYSSFGIDDHPGMRLIVFTPLDTDSTLEKLRGLLRPIL